MIIIGAQLPDIAVLRQIAAMNERRSVLAIAKDELCMSEGCLFSVRAYTEEMLCPRLELFDDHIEYTILPYKIFRAINKAIPLYKRRWILFCQLNFK